MKQHCDSRQIHIDYEMIGLNVTLSASMKSLKEQALAFIEKVDNDLKLIDLETEYRNEILLEYNKTLDLAKAKLNVINRHIELEEIKKQQLEQEEKQKAEQEVAQKVEEAIEEITVPKPEEVEPIMECTFKVRTTKDNLIKIKNYLKELGVEYD